jgi:hypothetical protein
MRWHSGTAHVLPEDDARRRHRELGRGRPGYQLDGLLLRSLSALGSGRMLTIRIDLNPPAGAREADEQLVSALVGCATARRGSRSPGFDLIVLRPSLRYTSCEQSRRWLG